jgi:hypothetical protein
LDFWFIQAFNRLDEGHLYWGWALFYSIYQLKYYCHLETLTKHSKNNVSPKILAIYRSVKLTCKINQYKTTPGIPMHLLKSHLIFK